MRQAKFTKHDRKRRPLSMLLKWGQTGDWKALVITCANFKPNLDYSPQDDRNSIKSVERKTMKRHPYNLEEAKRFNENLLPPTATQKKVSF